MNLMKKSNDGVPICRICLGEENTDANPLIHPCKCAGTMKFIHIECLREWINSKKAFKEGEYVTTYLWKVLSCELCKIKFPDKVITGTYLLTYSYF